MSVDSAHCKQCGVEVTSYPWPRQRSYCSEECKDAHELRLALRSDGKEIDWDKEYRGK